MDHIIVQSLPLAGKRALLAATQASRLLLSHPKTASGCNRKFLAPLRAIRQFRGVRPTQIFPL
jgi:hypothetical protein